MSSKALQQIRDRLKVDELRRVEIPEWGDADGPFVAFCRLPSVADVSDAAVVGKGDAGRMNVELVVMKACDEAGKPIFERIDAVDLMSMPGGAGGISRFIQAMGLNRTLESAAKN